MRRSVRFPAIESFERVPRAVSALIEKKGHTPSAWWKSQQPQRRSRYGAQGLWRTEAVHAHLQRSVYHRAVQPVHAHDAVALANAFAWPQPLGVSSASAP